MDTMDMVDTMVTMNTMDMDIAASMDADMRADAGAATSASGMATGAEAGAGASGTVAGAGAGLARNGRPLPEKIRAELRRNWELYIFVLPAVASVLLFNYLPMYGVQIAFKNFVPSKGIAGSEWVGLKWFARFFNSYQWLGLIRNSVALSFYTLIFSFPLPIVFALLVNQFRSQRARKAIQTISYAPHFISTVVVVGIVSLFLSPSTGLYGFAARALGAQPINPLGESSMFRAIYVASDVWQHMGWQSIIYVATLSTVSAELLDAARVDGASPMQRIWHVELPALRPTMTILLILSFGSLMSVGFEKAYLLQNPQNLATSEIMATYIYKVGLGGTPQYSYSAAIGLINSVVNVVLLLLFNAASRRFGETSLF
ncbi:MAG: ABC transporter permease subunit [Clostridiales bacterium]|jgi:putative aldouronate transport system permease protein|nr:ABC transporter permease subunit [Clostridiales bacterium]